MKIVAHTLIFYKYKDIKKVIQKLKMVGFDAFDMTLVDYYNQKDLSLIALPDYKQKAIELRRFIDSIGFPCVQAHAPFPTLPKDNPIYEERKEMIIRAIEVASILGAKMIVIHPYNYFRAKDNINLLNEYLPYAKKYNIKIGVENMWCWDEKLNRASEAACSNPIDYLETMKGLDPNYFTANVDIGHAEMFPEIGASKIIKTLGNYVGSLHIHDNDCHKDLHQIPFTNKINFVEIIKALQDINYQGDIVTECEGSFVNAPLEDLEKLASQLKDSANKLREMFVSKI